MFCLFQNMKLHLTNLQLAVFWSTKIIKKFFESVGHVPTQKEIDEAIEIVTKSKSEEKLHYIVTVCQPDRYTYSK